MLFVTLDLWESFCGNICKAMQVFGVPFLFHREKKTSFARCVCFFFHSIEKIFLAHCKCSFCCTMFFDMFSGSVFIYFFSLLFSPLFFISSSLFFCILFVLNCIAVCDLKAYKIPLDFWVPADRAMIAYSMDFCDAAPALDYEWGFVQKHTFYVLFFFSHSTLSLSFLFTPVSDSPFFFLFRIRPISLPFIQFRFLSIFSHSLEIGLFLFFASLGYFT